MLGPRSSLASFQRLNAKMYGVANDRYYSAEKMFMRLHRHITNILKAVRKKRYRNARYHLCMAFSWSLALFNRYHIELATDMWRRFPGCCPYCTCAPCRCKEKRRAHRRSACMPKRRKPLSLHSWQKMFAAIYRNAVLESTIHLAEEAGEVNEALHFFLSTLDDRWFDKVIEELVDVVTNIFGVANCLGLDLAVGVAEYFSRGCPRCQKHLCSCGFVAAEVAA